MSSRFLSPSTPTPSFSAMAASTSLRSISNTSWRANPSSRDSTVALAAPPQKSRPTICFCMTPSWYRKKHGTLLSGQFSTQSVDRIRTNLVAFCLAASWRNRSEALVDSWMPSLNISTTTQHFLLSSVTSLIKSAFVMGYTSPYFSPLAFSASSFSLASRIFLSRSSSNSSSTASNSSSDLLARRSSSSTCRSVRAADSCLAARAATISSRSLITPCFTSTSSHSVVSR
mmetsp:Transcript_18212/g.33669  ORF Transcript_18212/g.33669 Transcript_18212/m.33669 type:complete len:229 (-) Transcript_18212:152-838(-)